jgi:DNA-binding transcriptional LysR family regulator
LVVVGLDLRQLRYFVAVAEEANLSRAAARLYLSQQALSLAIRQLEQSAGATLLHRSARGVKLTDAGDVLLVHAQQVLEQADLLVRAMREHRDGHAGRLRLGLFMDGLGALTAPVISAFRTAHPGVTLSVRQLAAGDVLAAVLDHRVDAALATGPLTDERLRLTPLFSEPRVAVVSAASDLADADDLPTEDLLGRRVGARHPQVPAGWEQFYTLHAERGGEPERLPEPAETFEEILWNISLQDAVLTLPAHYTDTYQERRYGVRYRPVPELPPVASLLVQRWTSPDPLGDAFREVARRVTADLLQLLPGATAPPPGQSADT